MSGDPPSVCLVVPCYNEASRLRVRAFLDYLDANPAVRLLFVNDGSRDATASVLDDLAATPHGRISALHLERNVGKAEAVRAGLIAASNSAAVVGFWDADLATPLDALTSFLDVFKRREDIDWVIGSRVKLLGRRIVRQPHRHYLGRVFATGASLTLGIPVYDTQCGAKVFRTGPSLSRVLATPFTSRWIFDVEMLARLVIEHGGDPDAAARRVYELPLWEWEDVAGSKVRPTDFLLAFKDLLRIRGTLRSQQRALA